MHILRVSVNVAAFVAIAAVAAGCSWVIVATNAESKPLSADSWRRTADGWEKLDFARGSAMQSPSMRRSTPEYAGAANRGNEPRLDTHPAVLALFQITATLYVFACLPRYSTSPSVSWTAVRQVVKRSYRASFFGC